ncbi:MAG: hypothetical protein K2G37_05985 [Clostridia bacterium]|nr:hypothetical protein [Clostridia bacterium]MDE7328329.1 hypothetical protein [Clostridia bacterium]
MPTFTVKDKRQEYANYEQQAPDREFYYRHADSYDTQRNYGAQNYDCDFENQRAHDPHIIHQPNAAQRFIASFYQNQADRYVSGGRMPSYQQLDFTGTYGTYSNSYSGAQEYDYNSYEKTASYEQSAPQPARAAEQQRPVVRAKKRTLNSSMIKIVVAVMVVALLICGLLIANQFMSGNEAAAESEDVVQPVDSVIVATAYGVDGSSEMLPKIDVLPEYEYEESTNWFDKFCDFFSKKLK